MHIHHHPLRSPSLGSQRTVTSFHFGPAGQGEKVYIQASLHADELPGMLVAWHLKQQLSSLEDAGRLLGEIVLVPAANPIGLNQNQSQNLLGRFELQSGQNFNRHYPQLAQGIYPDIRAALGQDATANTALIRRHMQQYLNRLQPETELQSLRLTLHKLAVDADVVLDLHCDFRAALHVYTGTPLWPQCEPLARYLGASASLLATESGDQPFDEACSQPWWQLRELLAADGLSANIALSCLAVTVELRGQHEVNHALARQDAEGILNFLRLRGVVDEPVPPLPELPYPATPLAGSEDLFAPQAGVVVYHAEPGHAVKRGDLIAEIIDPISDQTSEVRANRGGMLYATSHRTYATAGMGIAKVASADTFKTGKLLTA
ncbi:MAG: succinylglutamate desuccinylase/aspartoacylase family protein [Paludibacterium sp.]|uniref:succinylglutamate desuccinylase/aspartoacylase family protein n=1 Tax=Paludibacterium sp. TaxID=1917523 RepID=UPI0025F187A6|nr:succinylglutamate desuccinylase/aspartoacylase family protein [Paludibacterium sp.]MBV8049264.1 succinylglutamate desuccinylase/aspartoacylase family protein [Paludibacterium sp.]MBV8648278.1 succinylglutamate desuccinylase/aspartoacylase family protein [Paludibacterium sp.]